MLTSISKNPWLTLEKKKRIHHKLAIYALTHDFVTIWNLYHDAIRNWRHALVEHNPYLRCYKRQMTEKEVEGVWTKRDFHCVPCLVRLRRDRGAREWRRRINRVPPRFILQITTSKVVRIGRKRMYIQEDQRLEWFPKESTHSASTSCIVYGFTSCRSFENEKWILNWHGMPGWISQRQVASIRILMPKEWCYISRK